MSPETRMLVFGEIAFLCVVLLAVEARRYFGGLSRTKRRASMRTAATEIAPSRAAMLARPDSYVAPLASKKAPWEAFINDQQLLSSYRITPAEIESLRHTSMLGTVQSKDDILFILKTIRASARH